MAIPIASFQDILDVLEQNPEYREAMRRHVLDEEIRRLPAEFRALRETVDNLVQAVHAYMETTNERLSRLESDTAELKKGQAKLVGDVAELKEGQAKLVGDVAELKEGQSKLEGDVAELKEGQSKLEGDVAELKEGQAKLEAGQSKLEAGQARLEGRIGDVAGTNYERRIAKHCRSIVSRRLGIKRVKILHSISIPDNDALDDLMHDASEAGSITDEQAIDLDRADIIVTGVSAPGQVDYAVIEVSETVDDSDVDRAQERAAILAQAVHQPVTAAVIGQAISDANRQRADQNDVAVIIMAE